jgi:hypothetical protein
MEVPMPSDRVTVTIPGVGTVLTTPAGVKVFEKRQQFTRQYCKDKGWSTNPEELSLDQIMEIRAQPGWSAAADGQNLDERLDTLVGFVGHVFHNPFTRRRRSP